MEIYEESVLRENKIAPNYTKQVSYYGKAKEIEKSDFKYLKSYQTIVCAIAPNGAFFRLWDGYSVTTMNHINEFRINNGLKPLNKKEWKALPIEDFNVPSEVKNVEMNYKTTYGEYYY